jgi:glucose-6-phosphate isomerase
MYSAHDLLTRWPVLNVAARRAKLQDSLRLTPGPLSDVIAASTPAAERLAGALWLREPSAWSGDASERQTIANRLGWMSSPFLMADSIQRLQTFAATILASGFTDVVLLGMGGSSLAPEVMRSILGVAPGWPRFRMLDSTDPAAIRAAATPPATTLYLFSSKSGTTIEANSLAAHFRAQLEYAGVARWADHFVAITDEDTALARWARADGFRDVFINPSDIGGRYSTLSFSGMVPAALMGADIASLIGWSVAMGVAAEPGFGTAVANPATALGLALGAGARAGRDKLTLMVPPQLESFGLWVEQLIAGSTGKKGTGVIPITGEPAADPLRYGSDRLFVRVNATESMPPSGPGVDITLAEPAAIGAEFVRWEIATAVAGGLLHINPFDEPNVQHAKTATRKLLDEFRTTGSLPQPSPATTFDNGVTISATAAARRYLGTEPAAAILTLLRTGDYFALLAYAGPDPALADELRALRQGVVAATGAATMFGYGPRYLHSTGQLHKGGPNTGVFILISATPTEDMPIPGEPFSFGTLERAQALGDFASLDATDRRAVHVQLQSPDAVLLAEVVSMLLAHVGGRSESRGSRKPGN